MFHYSTYICEAPLTSKVLLDFRTTWQSLFLGSQTCGKNHKLGKATKLTDLFVKGENIMWGFSRHAVHPSFQTYIQRLKTNDCDPLTRPVPHPNLFVLPPHSTTRRLGRRGGCVGDRREEGTFTSGSHEWNGRKGHQKARRNQFVGDWVSVTIFDWSDLADCLKFHRMVILQLSWG